MPVSLSSILVRCTRYAGLRHAAATAEHRRPLPFAMRARYRPAQYPQPSNGVIGNKPQHGVINTNERDLCL